MWRPQKQLIASTTSLRQLQIFSDRGGIAVNFDVMRSAVPNIEMFGGLE